MTAAEKAEIAEEMNMVFTAFEHNRVEADEIRSNYESWEARFGAAFLAGYRAALEEGAAV